MKRLFFLIVILFSFFYISAQDDPKAKKILDQLTATFKTHTTISSGFTATVRQMQDQSESSYQGKIWLKGNKYKLELQDNIIFFDGKKIYQYIPEANEVNISLPDPEDEDLQLLNPQTIINLSSKNFRSNLVRESTVNNRKVYEVDLYPKHIKNTQYSRVRLSVEKETYQIVSVSAFLKNGTQYLISIDKYNTTQSLSDSFFIFNPNDYPGVEIIDLNF